MKRQRKNNKNMKKEIKLCNSFLGINIFQLGLEQQLFPPSKYQDPSAWECNSSQMVYSTHPPFQRMRTFFSEIFVLTISLHVTDPFNYTYYNHTQALSGLHGCSLALQRHAGTARTLLLRVQGHGKCCSNREIIYCHSSSLKGSMCFVTNESILNNFKSCYSFC